jgi:hypothetical protein
MPKIFLKAIEINPQHSRAMNYFGYACVKKGIKLNESELLLVKSVTLESKNGVYLDFLGRFTNRKNLLLRKGCFFWRQTS